MADVIKEFFNRVIEDLQRDAQSKNQKIPVNSFRVEAIDTAGNLYAADYFKYLIYGRGPGKQPPIDSMLAWVQGNSDALARTKQVYKYITEQGLAYLIGRKIAKEGTDIYTGKKQGIDLLGSIEKEMPELLSTLAKNETFKIVQALNSALK